MKNRQDPIFENDTLGEGDVYVGEDGLLRTPEGDFIPCNAIAYPATWDYPAEYCDNDATVMIDDEPYCADHAVWWDGPDPDDERDRLADLQWERDNDPDYGLDY